MADITKINLNGTELTIVDSAATSAIAGEIARAQGAESAITSALSAEVVARQSADTALEQAIAAKADSASTYTKTEVDTALAGKANTATTYTKTEVDTALAGKANTATTYTKSEVDTALAGKQNTLSAGTGIQISGDVISCTVDTGLYVVVQTLPAQPAAGNENKIHLVPLPASATGQNDQYEEYLWKGTEWEYLGVRQADIDLTDYWTSAQTQSAITDATSNLASTDYVQSAITDATSGLASTTYVDNALSGKVDTQLYTQDYAEMTAATQSAQTAADAAQGDIDTHIANHSNPHQVTAAQLGISASYSAATETLILNIPASS